MAVYAKNVKNTSYATFSGEFDTRDFLILLLSGASQKQAQAGNDQLAYRYQHAGEVLEKYVARLEFRTTDKHNEFKYDVDIIAHPDESREDIQRKIEDVIIRDEEIFKLIDVLILKKLQELHDKTQPKKKTHKQPRTLGRDIARNVGKDTKQPSIFDLPLSQLDDAIAKLPKGEDGIPIKEKMSRNVAILSQKLLQQYQELKVDTEGYIEIQELGKLAESLHTDTKELKYYLLHLGGFQFPSVTVYDDRSLIGLQFAKLFYIEFMYKRRKGDEENITEEVRADTAGLILNKPIHSIRVKPSEQFIRDLKGGGKRSLGYVNVSDKFIALCMGLSDYAYKLFSYSYTQKASYKIGEKNLFMHLGLEDQVKKQGRPRMRKAIDDAFAELKAHGHFAEYTITSAGDGTDQMYEWARSEKYIKDAPARKKAEGEGEYIDFNDANIPAEKRKAAYMAWLINSKGRTPAAAKKMAEKKFGSAGD